MVSIDDFSRVVSAIYTAASTPEHWDVAIGEVQRALDGTCGALLVADAMSRSVRSSTLPADAAKSYMEYYFAIDHVLAAVERGPVGALRSGTELTPVMTNTEFHTDWLRPHDLGDGLFVRLSGGAVPACFLVSAPRRTEAFDTAERVKLMSGLTPHLQQAVRTQSKLAALTQGCADLAEALHAVRHGTRARVRPPAPALPAHQ
jgi:hypothetical protein